MWLIGFDNYNRTGKMHPTASGNAAAHGSAAVLSRKHLAFGLYRLYTKEGSSLSQQQKTYEIAVYS